MSVSEVPVVPGVPHQELQLPVGERVYSLELRWSVREARWYLDVRDEEAEPIYLGIAVVLNFPLGFRCVDERWWAGYLCAIDTSNTNVEPTLDDLGARVKLIYIEDDA